jgi:proteasome lid subunit RPN8/RPN11
VSTPFRLLLPRPLYAALLEQARAELPNECCGLLGGRVEDGVGRVERRYPLINALASPVEYESEPRGMFQAERDMRQHGLRVLAVYHSHPTSEPVPSRKDCQRNYSPDVMNLIISPRTGGPPVRAWWLGADGYREAEWEVGEQSG